MNVKVKKKVNRKIMRTDNEFLVKEEDNTDR